MASPFRDRLATLHHAAHNTLHTSQEIDDAINAAELLASLHHKHLPSPWDVPRLLCGALRAQLLAHTAAADSPDRLSVRELSRLFTAAWAMCPLPSLPPPAASPTSVSGLVVLTPRDEERVAEELAGLQLSAASSPPSPAGETAHCGTSVILSLLTYWHLLAVEDGKSEEEFERVSESVWRCVHRWTAAQGAAAACALARTTWLRTVLRRALRGDADGDTPQLLGTVQWLSEFLAAAAAAASSPSAQQSAVADAALDACWARLHAGVCQRVAVQLHTLQSALKLRWAEQVTPVLTQLCSHEPPPLSGAALRGLSMEGEPLEAALRALLTEAARLHDSPTDGAQQRCGVAEVARILSPMLALCELQQHGEAVGFRPRPFVTPQHYATYIRPVVAASLRWSFTGAARALLGWAGDSVDDHGSRWRDMLGAPSAGPVHSHQLQSSGQGSCSTPFSSPCRALQEASNCSSPSTAEADDAPSPSFLLSPQHALSVLVEGGDRCQLHWVCDALLRRPAPWSASVLSDPFAPFFVLRGLSRLCAALLDVGDCPLARCYGTLLGQLTPRYLCPTLLREVLSLLRRQAHMLSAYCVSPLDYSVAASAQGEAVMAWQRVRQLFAASKEAETLQLCNREAFAPAVPYVMGMAIAARQEYARFLTAAAAAPVDGVPACKAQAAGSDGPVSGSRSRSGVVVEVEFTAERGGTLWLRRSLLSRDVASPSPSSTSPLDQGSAGAAVVPLDTIAVRCSGCGEALRGCAAAMTDALHRNREQLTLGSDSGAAAATERGRCADSAELPATSAAPAATCCSLRGDSTPTDRRTRKELWWQARFAIDQQIGAVVEALQDTLGVLRLLLVGHVSASLQAQLNRIAATFAAECVRLRGAASCPPLRALREAAKVVLLGAPYLWSSPALPAAVGAAQRTSLCCPEECRGCLACSATRRRAHRSFLSAVVEVGQQLASTDAFPCAAHHTDGSSSSSSIMSGDEEGRDLWWLELPADASLTAVVDLCVTGAMKAYYDATPASEAGQTSARDVLLIPRAHTHIALAGELHTLPWEGIDVCDGRSVSRVPSRRFLVDALRCGQQCDRRISLRHVLVYRDTGEAAPSTSTTTTSSAAAPCELDCFLARHPAWEVMHGDTFGPASAALRSGASPSSAVLSRLVGSASTGEPVDAYLYSGHKGGEHLLPRRLLYEWAALGAPHSLPPLVLLMGCSSARTHGNALYESYGLPLAYLSAGVPCMVGCLWDVTDGDIDRLTCRLLATAMAAAGEAALTVGECVAVARQACRLRHLTGLSTVLYGLNLTISS